MVNSPDCNEDSPAACWTSDNATSSVPAAPLSRKLESVAPVYVLLLNNLRSTKPSGLRDSTLKNTTAAPLKTAASVITTGFNHPRAEPCPMTMFTATIAMMKDVKPNQSKRRFSGKVTLPEKRRFDWFGFTSFIIAMVAVNIVIGQGSALGWLNPVVITLALVFVLAAAVFFRVESRKPDGFVDLRLFNNKTYTGATLSNFLLNGAAGTLLVALSLVQQAAGLSSLQSGLLTIGYLVAILSTIRVGEKLLQK